MLARRIEQLCWLLLLTVIALRPLISESYSTQRTNLASALAEIDEAMPVRTLALDAVILGAAVLWLGSRAAGPRQRYRPVGIEIGAIVVAVAGLISCSVASNQRVAITATLDWLCLPVLTIVLVQLTKHPWQIRLLLCVVLASAAAQAYECFNQVFYTFPETQRLYESQKDEMWAAAGVEADSPQVALYERRILAREASGFLTHSNVTGGYLVLCGLAALGLAWSRWQNAGRLSAMIVTLVAVGILGAAALTRSKGAIAAGVLALAICLVTYRWRGWMEKHRRRTLIAGWAVVASVCLAVLAWGVVRGGLPGSSLDFRWGYWTASWEMFSDHGVTGVGRENFGSQYLAYKSIDSPEEVTNPHNFLVTTATEWGAPGALGVLLMLVGGSIAATRRPVGPDVSEQPGSSWVLWGTITAAVVFGVRLLLLSSSNADYLVYATAFPALFWLIGFSACATEPASERRFSNRPLRDLARVANIALLAFLLQDTINFGLFVPGAATTFFALLAVPIALRYPPAERSGSDQGDEGSDSKKGPGRDLARKEFPPARSRIRWAVPVIGLAVLALFVGKIVLPAWTAGRAISRARNQAGRAVLGAYSRQPVYDAYMAAADADPLDPTPLSEAASWLVAFADGIPDDGREARDAALQRIEEAIQRDPSNIGLRRQKSRMALHMFQSTGSDRYLDPAIDASRSAAHLYPKSPEAHIDLGRVLLLAGEERSNSDLLREGVEELQQGLDLDSLRPAWEELRRLSDRRRSAIRAMIEEARTKLDELRQGR